MANYETIDNYPDDTGRVVRKAPEKKLVKIDSYYRRPKSVTDPDEMAEKERQDIIDRNKSRKING